MPAIPRLADMRIRRAGARSRPRCARGTPVAGAVALLLTALLGGCVAVPTGTARQALAAPLPQAEAAPAARPLPRSASPHAHRLIVEFGTPAMAEVYALHRVRQPSADPFADVEPIFQAYAIQLRNEHRAFALEAAAALPFLENSRLLGINAPTRPLAFSVVKNGVVLAAPHALSDAETAQLRSLPNVKAVHRDREVFPQLYAGAALVQAEALWRHPDAARAQAGQGILIASLDSGVHKDAPMFDGAAFAFPAWMPPPGQGRTEANNGKIIVSRVYFRTGDPPLASDHFPWPGSSSSHGVHTAAIAAGNPVTDAHWNGLPLPTLSGMAPGAWLGNYRVFYRSQSGKRTFFTAEGVAALEDAVLDGAHVLIGAWGIGSHATDAPYDFLDAALVNANRAGVFVVMAAGNYGPLPFSVANPSAEYLTAGAVTTPGKIIQGHARVTSAQDALLMSGLEFAPARFGPQLAAGAETALPLIAAHAVNPANALGCQPWPASALAGRILVVARGQCRFSAKVAHAAHGGASAVLVFNHAQGGDALLEMVLDEGGPFIPIPSFFIGHRAGTLLHQLLTQHADELRIHFSTQPKQQGNQPFVVPAFSGRGPTRYGRLKPDLVAPGVNIVSQGYAQAGVDAARHLGFGQESGTSMATPFAAGAVAALKSRHPHWTHAMIKSALMSTAQYEGIFNHDGSVAQPTDMGAGLIDMARALNPPAFLEPPQADFGRVRRLTGTLERQIEVLNPGAETVTFDVAARQIRGDGAHPLPAVTVSPARLAIPPRKSRAVTVSLDLAAARDRPAYLQGFLVFDSPAGQLHAPLFAWLDAYDRSARILLLDADLSPAYPDYAPWFRHTLDALGASYLYWDASRQDAKVPPALNDWENLETVILFTGDREGKAAASPVPAALTEQDRRRLDAFVADGGSLLAMGHGIAALLEGSEMRARWLGATQIQALRPDAPNPRDLWLQTAEAAPEGLPNLTLDLGPAFLSLGSVHLRDPYKAQDASTANTASFALSPLGALQYQIQLAAPSAAWVEEAWFYTYSQGDAPLRVHELFAPRHRLPARERFQWQGQLQMGSDVQAARLNGSLYLAVRLTEPEDRTLVGQVPVQGAVGNDGDAHLPLRGLAWPLEDTTVQPFLETAPADAGARWLMGVVRAPDSSAFNSPAPGRILFTTFGLERVNEREGFISRADFLQAMLDYLAPTATSETGAEDASP